MTIRRISLFCFESSHYPNVNWTQFQYDATHVGLGYERSDDFNLYAVNAATGALVWKFTTTGPVDTWPVVANGVTYLGGYQHLTR